MWDEAKAKEALNEAKSVICDLVVGLDELRDGGGAYEAEIERARAWLRARRD